MQDFDFVSAKTVNELVALLAPTGDPGGKAVRILSGGTDLLVQLREGRKAADLVVDVKRVPELNELIYEPERGLTIGAAVSCLRICSDPQVTALYPGLVDGIGVIGGMQVQGRASVGGNLCNASPAADSTPALIVHQAVCQIAGPEGKREVPVESFCAAPGQTILQPGEFLVSLRVPPVKAGFGARYLRFIPRNEMDIAVVGVGASVVLSEDGAAFLAARIALGAVAPVPLFIPEAGEWLAGKDVTPDNIFQAARMAQAAVRPISDMRGSAEQRRHLSLILTRRAIQGAIERARGLGRNGRGNGHHDGLLSSDGRAGGRQE